MGLWHSSRVTEISTGGQSECKPPQRLFVVEDAR
jgi:hypothetical protein